MLLVSTIDTLFSMLLSESYANPVEMSCPQNTMAFIVAACTATPELYIKHVSYA